MFLCVTHPGIVKVRLVVTTKAVVGDLKLLGSVHVQSCSGERKTNMTMTECVVQVTNSVPNVEKDV